MLHYTDLPIKEITKKHVRFILDNMPNLKVDYKEKDSNGELKTHYKPKIWNENQYNRTRKNMGILFEELSEYEVIDTNPVYALKKKEISIKIKDNFTPEERKRISEYLKENNYRFYLFLNIFFHSGAREIEFERLKLKDINLDKLTIKITIKKGRQSREVYKPIKHIALPFWKEYLGNYTNPEWYFLGEGLIPAAKPIDKSQITRRWKRYVKDQLGINKNFYWLKALNLDEIAAQSNIEDAARMADHTTTKVTEKHYAQHETERRDERLRNMKNEF
jgi:integrase